jgi:hypothetical protein
MAIHFERIFISRGVALLGAIVLVASFSAYGFLWATISGGAGHAGEPVLLRITPLVWFSVILYGIVAGQFILLAGVYFTHKVAGPLFRLEKMTDAAMADDLPGEVTFRQGDQMQPLARAQSRMFAFLAGREREIEAAGARAEKARDLLAERIQAAAPAEWSKLVDAMQAELAAVAAAARRSPGGGRDA